MSPFGSSGGGWSSGPTIKQSAAAVAVAVAERPGPVAPSPVTPGPVAVEAPIAAEPEPVPPVPAPAESNGHAEVIPISEGVAPRPAPPAPGIPDTDTLRDAIVAALSNGGHNSAAELLRVSSYISEGASLRIEVPGIGKKMLALTVNPAAEKIIRQELQRLNAPSRYMVVPGEGAAPKVGPATITAAAGSIQEAALANPLVERAKEIFRAEVRSVVDLRQK